MQKLSLKGYYKLVHKDKFGKVISEETVENLITNEGKNYVLDAAFNTTALTTVSDIFYFIIQTSGTAAASDTYATPVRTESTNYTEGLRQVWGAGAAASQSVTNASAATITADTGGITVTGIGVVTSPSEQTGGAAGDVDTKGDATCSDGVLVSTADVSKTLAESETLDITYTVNA